jgi:uncharacterized membrane protein YkvA (DUF1232 family)
MAKEKPVNARSRWGMIGDLIRYLRLAWRLFKDRRVPIWLKSIPLLALVYLLWPLDLLTDLVPGLGQVDDLTLLLMSLVLFVSLCPAQLVTEYQGSGHALKPVDEPFDEQVIETTFRVVDDDRQR